MTGYCKTEGCDGKTNTFKANGGHKPKTIKEYPRPSLYPGID